MHKSVSRSWSGHRGVALLVLLTGAFLPPLDYFIVNLALPSIRAGLHTDGAVLQLIISAYAAVYATLLITGGRLGDLFGRKRIFMIGLAGFTLASLLCGLAPSGAWLIAGRIVQATAAAVLAPQVLASIRTLFSASEQAKVMGIYGFVFGISSVVGQLGGGLLITLHPFGLGWQSIFLVNLPIGILALVGAWFFVPESDGRREEKLDLPGVGLVSLCLALVIVPLTLGRESGWPLWTYVSFAASVPVFWLFVRTEQRMLLAGKEPLVDLSLFKNRTFAIGLMLAFLFYCLSVYFMTYGVYLQSGLHWSPLESGLAIMPYTAGFVIGSPLSSTVARRVGNHVLTLGFGMMAAGFTFAILALARSLQPDLLFYCGLSCAGIGQGFVLPSVVRVVLSAVDKSKAGLASGVVTSVLQLGAGFGAAAIGGIFFSRIGTEPGAFEYKEAFRLSLGIVVALEVVCVGLCTILVRNGRSQRGMAERLIHHKDATETEVGIGVEVG